ncbi:MAG: uroporphyrinogen-III synthase [Deltaproteobacteria bacterium]|nr:uroporphyrinogen-III synthase [Deltaproteobacteria bacterium]
MIGWTVIVARDDAPDDDVSLALLGAGARVVPLRLMRMEAIPFVLPAGPFDVTAFASRNAVDAFPLAVSGRIAAVGKVTAARLQERGVVVDVVGDAGGQALACLLIAQGIAGQRVLLPRTEGGNDDLKTELEQAGAVVVVVDVTRSVPIEVDVGAVWASTAAPRALVLTSPKRVHALSHHGPIPADVVVVAIGATTAEALQEAGRRADVVAARPDPEALLEALRVMQK